jgi:DNA-binding IclR family transcriptional regulator
MLVSNSYPFGGRARTAVLVALAMLRDSYPRELSRLLQAPLSGVQRALTGLERDGLVVGRSAGRTRLFELNPRYFAETELRSYLRRLAEPEDQLKKRIAALRRRPRQTGKRL